MADITWHIFCPLIHDTLIFSLMLKSNNGLFCSPILCQLIICLCTTHPYGMLAILTMLHPLSFHVCSYEFSNMIAISAKKNVRQANEVYGLKWHLIEHCCQPKHYFQ